MSARRAKIEFEGVDELIRGIKRAGKLGQKAAEQGIEVFALVIQEKSAAIVPFDTGELQAGFIDEPIKKGVKVIGYSAVGKDGFDYAAIQHEESFNHPGRQSISPLRGAKGQKKYLESPLKESASLMAKLIAQKMRDVL